MAGPAELAARADAALGGSPLQLWSRPGERGESASLDLPFGAHPRGPPTLEGADLAVARGPEGSAHVAVTTNAPPRLLVYRWATRRGLSLRVVRAVGADLELERVP